MTAASPPIPDATAGAHREERLHALDHLRAVAMLLGIALHAGISFMTLPMPWAARDVSRHWSFDPVIGLIHGFRMQLFFFIAGFFARLVCERLGIWKFAKHRLQRIGMPFVLGMVVLVPMLGWLWMWGMARMDPPMKLPMEPPKSWTQIPTAHLWFLQYLLVFYTLAVAGVGLLRWVPGTLLAAVDRAFDWLMQSKPRLLLLVPLTLLCLWDGPMLGEVEQAGVSLMPKLRVVGYYGLFFAVGWWLHRRRADLGLLAQGLKWGFAGAALALVLHWAVLVAQPKAGQPNFLALKLAGLVGAAAYAWLMTFAVTGWFLRFTGHHQPWMRYLADASYWCYLIHLPLVVWLQVLVAKWPVNGWLKFTGINLVAMILLLLTYEWFVRYTFIGTVLNGRRERVPKEGHRAGATS